MKQITEDYVSYEIAKLLKEKGFDEPTLWFYVGDGTKLCAHKTVGDDWWRRPTQQMAMRWLRKVHKIFIQIDYDYYVNDGFYYGYSTIRLEQKNEYDEVETKIGERMFNTYEEAVEAALLYVLKNLI